MSDVTHLVYAALQENPGLFAGWLDDELMERNAAMLRNLFEPLSRAATGLRHVSLLHGTKAYGIHHPSVGTAGVHIPLREREPRREHPNFYFLQEDYLRERQRGRSWALTIFRPTVVYGDAPGNNMNPMPVIAAYGAILRERGEPLHFPGRPGAPALREAVDADLIASALAWAAESPAAAGGTYNLTNGDVFMWDNAWPAIADALGMEPGEPRHISLAAEMPNWADEWRAIVRKYELNAPEELLEFVGANSLTYTDMVLSSPAAGHAPHAQQHHRHPPGRLPRLPRHRGHVPGHPPQHAGRRPHPAAHAVSRHPKETSVASRVLSWLTPSRSEHALIPPPARSPSSPAAAAPRSRRTRHR